MLPFGNQKLKKKLETYERELVEQRQRLRQKDAELSDNKKHFLKYKNHVEAKLMKNEEIIRNLSERWDTLENNFIEREEQLRDRLDRVRTTQEELINKLEMENKTKRDIIKDHEEILEKQNNEIRRYEDKLEFKEEEIRHMKEELKSRDKIIKNNENETENFQQKIEMLNNEIAKLNSKLDNFQLESEKKHEHLQSALNTKEEKVKELENKLLLEESKNKKLDASKKEEIEGLRKIIENKKKEVQEKTKYIETLKSKNNLLSDIEREYKEVNNQNVCLKKDIDEKNKNIKEYKNEIHNKDKKISDLQSLLDVSNKHISTKEELIKQLDLKNKALEDEHQNKLVEFTDEKRKNEDVVTKLKEKILQNEKMINQTTADIKNLELKLKESEQANKELAIKSKLDQEKSKDHFMNIIQSKDSTIENLEICKKRAFENLAQKNDIITHMEREIKDNETKLSNKENELNNIKKKLEDIVRQNEVLEYKVNQIDELKNIEINTIDIILREQVRLINHAYQIEWETREHQTLEFIRNIELFVGKQIGNHEKRLKIIEDVQQATDQLVLSTNKKIEECTNKMKEHKIHLESLQKTITEIKLENKEMKEELERKDMVHGRQKRQMNENFKLLQTEILKSEIGTPLTELNNENNMDAPAMENILRQIHTRNVVMKELREDIQAKQDTILRLQQKYQKLSEKIKRVVITVTNAKFAYQELEKENKRLRNTLAQNKNINETIEETRTSPRRARPTISESYSEYDIRNRKLDALSNMTSDLKSDNTSVTPPLQALCEELESIRETSQKQIENVEQHTGLQKNIDYLKTEIQKERKLRKKQEALFSSVLNTLNSASTSFHPDNPTYHNDIQ